MLEKPNTKKQTTLLVALGHIVTKFITKKTLYESGEAFLGMFHDQKVKTFEQSFVFDLLPSSSKICKQSGPARVDAQFVFEMPDRSAGGVWLHVWI